MEQSGGITPCLSFPSFGVANLVSRYYVKLYIFVFRCVNSMASPLLSDLFVLRSNARSAQTRGMSTSCLVLPSVLSAAGLRSLSFCAADRWNNLPPEIRCCNSLHVFPTEMFCSPWAPCSGVS